MSEKSEEEQFEEAVQKSSWSGFIWAMAFITVVLVLFAVGYLGASSDKKFETVEYNNFEFTKIAGLWHTQWQSGNEIYTIPLRFNPTELEDIQVVGSLAPEFNRNKVHITFNPTKGNFSMMALSAAELSSNLIQALKVTPVGACTINETDACATVPIVDCSTPNRSVIVLKGGGSAGIVLNGECIELLGDGFDLLRSTERLIYQWYGIMK